MRYTKKILVPVLFMLLPVSAMTAEEAFTVRNIEINHSGDDPATAKGKAIEAGETGAFQVLLQNLGVQENSQANLTPEQIGLLIESYQLQNEKATPESYSASLTVSFNPGLVRAWLKKANLNYQETGAKQSYLVIPVLYQGGKTLLWEPENSWRAALAKAAAQNNSATLILPLGDSEDVKLLAIKDIESGELAPISALAGKYGVKNIMLVEAWNDGKELTVSTTAIRDNVKQKQQSFKFPQAVDNPDIMKNAAQEIAANIGSQTGKADKPEILVNQPVISVRAEFKDIAEWLAIKDKLQKMDFIRRAEIKELGGSSANIDIYYQANVKNIAEMFPNYGMKLSDESGAWILREDNKPHAAAAPATSSDATAKDAAKTAAPEPKKTEEAK